MIVGQQTRPSPLALLGAFAAIYLIWGSTYLAILIGIESIPPFLMAGWRFLLAGVVLFAWMHRRGERTTWSQWKSAIVLGTLMMCGGNGLVTWAELRVPSSVAALMIATVPLWMTILDGFVFGGSRPTPSIWVGLLLGFAGVALLVSPGRNDAMDPLGAVALLAAAFFWAVGSLRSRGADQPRSPALAAAMQMIGGGMSLLLVGTLRGEWSGWDITAVSSASWWAVGYLVVFGSILALSAYVWLLRVSSAARVSTYAFVNPVVAVILGALFAHEALGGRTAIAATLIVGAVVFIHWTKMRVPRPRRRRHAPACLADPAPDEA